MAIARFCTIAAPGSRTIAAHEEALHFVLQFGQGCFESFQPRIDDDGPLWIQPIQSEAYGLAEPPLDAVAYDRRAERARNGETDPRAGVQFPTVRAFSEVKGRK
jgi:hypothetical protein